MCTRASTYENIPPKLPPFFNAFFLFMFDIKNSPCIPPDERDVDIFIRAYMWRHLNLYTEFCFNIHANEITHTLSLDPLQGKTGANLKTPTK